jgi:pyruvate/oxaloacetate carboxyltransferase
MITNEVKDLADVLYGKTPISVDPEIQKKSEGL